MILPACGAAGATAVTAEAQLLPLRITRAVDAAEGIRQFELMHPDGAELPAFTAGSHVAVRAPNGALRKYSLCNDPAERHRYLITVKRDAHGRGGSRSLVDYARAGDWLPTSLPDNAFPLAEAATAYLFIAGGIGITPIISMIRSLGALPPTPWKLCYLTRSPQATAFLDELQAPKLGARVVIHHDRGDPAKAYDLWPVLERSGNAHLYCCGPRPLLDAVRDMTGHWMPGRVHFESFSDGATVRPEDFAFTVRLARSGRWVGVPAGKSALTALREAGCSIASSCESGTCGSCRITLLGGEADHRDLVLMPDERAGHFMVCVSRARSPELVLDL